MRRALLLPCFALLCACATTDGEAEKNSPEDEAAPTPKAAPEVTPTEDEGPSPKPTTAVEGADAPPPGVKVHGNLPVMTESELAAEDAEREKCVSECVESKQAEARAPEAIEGDCRQACLQKIPIRQVEVVSDGPPI